MSNKNTARVVWIGTINKERWRVVVDGGERTPYIAVERMDRDNAGGARWDYIGTSTSTVASTHDATRRDQAIKRALASLPAVRGGR